MSVDDEIYEMGKREGYEEAVQAIDVRTGGNGEFVCVLGGPSERHCPDAAAMQQRIIDRFENQVDTLRFIAPSLLVLRNMCARAGLKLGEAKAIEMINEVRRVLCEDPADTA